MMEKLLFFNANQPRVVHRYSLVVIGGTARLFLCSCQQMFLSPHVSLWRYVGSTGFNDFMFIHFLTIGAYLIR